MDESPSDGQLGQVRSQTRPTSAAEQSNHPPHSLISLPRGRHGRSYPPAGGRVQAVPVKSTREGEPIHSAQLPALTFHRCLSCPIKRIHYWESYQTRRKVDIFQKKKE